MPVGVVEHSNHAVAGVLEHAATSRLHRAVHEIVVDLERCSHRIAVCFPQRGRPDHVGHHEHHRSHSIAPKQIKSEPNSRGSNDFAERALPNSPTPGQIADLGQVRTRSSPTCLANLGGQARCPRRDWKVRPPARQLRPVVRRQRLGSERRCLAVRAMDPAACRPPRAARRSRCCKIRTSTRRGSAARPRACTAAAVRVAAPPARARWPARVVAWGASSAVRARAAFL